PVYKIHAKLLISDESKGGGMLSSSALGDLSGFVGGKSSVDNEVEILRTSDLMRKMVLAEKAYISYFNKGRVHQVPVSTAPFRVDLLTDPDSITGSYALDVQITSGDKVQLLAADTAYQVFLNQPFTLPGGGMLRIQQIPGAISKDNYGFRVSPVRAVTASFSSRLSVSTTNKSVSTIDVSFDHTSPEYGEQLLTTVIDEYVKMNLHDKNVIADSTLAFINVRLRKITDELAGVEDRISGFKKRNQLADISQQGKMLIESSASFTKSLAEVETQLAALDVISAYLQDSNNPRVVPSAVMLQDGGFGGLIQRYNELVLQRERLLLANTEDNPLVQNIASQIAGARQDMIANLSSTRRQLELMKQSQQGLANNVS